MFRASILGFSAFFASSLVPMPAAAATVLVQDQAQIRAAAFRDHVRSANQPRPPAIADGGAGISLTERAAPALSALLAGGFAMIMVLRRRKKPPTVIN